MVHNASQIYIPDGDNRNPYDIGQPQNSSYGNLLQIRSDKNKNGNSILYIYNEFTKCFHEYLYLCREHSHITSDVLGVFLT